VQLGLQARQHIDVHTCRVIGRAFVTANRKHINSTDVEWCGVGFNCPGVASTL